MAESERDERDDALGRDDARAQRISDTIHMMELDFFTADVIGHLEDRGVTPILLKGPSLAAWLYPERSERLYGDADILVGPAQWSAAVAALGELGLVEQRQDEAAIERESHAVAFSDGQRWSVDLHHSIWGLSVPEEQQWEAVIGRAVTMPLTNRDVRILDETTRALHVALHAAQHGRCERKPVDDLELALVVVDKDGWTDVAERAEKLGAVPALSAGLRLLPDGAAVADQLQLPEDVSAEIRLRLEGGGGAPGMMVARIAAAPSIGLKLRYLLRWIFPSRAKIERLSTEESTGRWGLVRAYLRHFRQTPDAIDAVRAWRRARQPEAGRQPTPTTTRGPTGAGTEGVTDR